MDNINDINNTDSAFVQDDDLYGKKIKPQPRADRINDIDVKGEFIQAIADEGVAGTLDISRIENFTTVSKSRDQIYQMLDTMSEDTIISAALETYTEDSTEYNNEGKIVWAESADAEITKYITYLLDTLNIDKNIYKWTYSLCKYGDLYLRLYRESEYDDPIFKRNNDDRKQLNEDVIVRAYGKNDKYAHYMEMVPNPAEMFELTRFGKTVGYIKTNMQMLSSKTNFINTAGFYQYKFQKKDVEVYPATEFVHACLEDVSTRTPEEVELFLQDNTETTNDVNTVKYSYRVRRGQSLLYTLFKVWRELSLLEDSVLLNRITKSSIIRIIGIQVGDMPKENIGPYLQRMKSLVEQKTALNSGEYMSEYTNPGPVENNVYVPIDSNGKGTISTQSLGGDVDVKSLADLDYFKQLLYSGLRIPKQFLGDTDDATGFNGGTSLALVSSRYAKAVKKIQNTLVQAITDAINLMLMDKGLDSYINKFEIHMLPPTTQEEVDRQSNLSNNIGIVRDIMDVLSDIDDVTAKLKILKSLLSDVITDGEVIEVIQEYIEELESQEEETGEPVEEDSGGDDFSDHGGGGETDINLNFDNDVDELEAPEMPEGEEESGEGAEETTLPSAEELGVDLTDNTAEI